MTSGFRLGDWLVQPDQCRISTADRTVQVRAKVMDLLTFVFLTVDPKWDDYRSEPRFKRLLERCGFVGVETARR